ncbi:MAG: hypothetical protein IJN74_05840 [Clostridia bacterium]|nr:hypothetical protein [Clostridia bacterium]
MKEKHLFAGVNSPKGFYSCFDEIMKEAPGARKIYIKGGPGMGKSSLMKKIIHRATEEGLSSEVFHCSSDPSSVDGVHIPALETAIIDATAPHNADPALPCVCGEIFDVSVCASNASLDFHAGDILQLSECKKKYFQKGYHYLEATVPLLKQIENEYLENTDVQGIYLEAEKLAKRLLGTWGRKENGTKRKLFLSAITPEGFVSYADTYFKDTFCIAVKGDYAASLFLKRIADVLSCAGFSLSLFYCPMQPDEKIEHIYIPALRVSLSTYNFYTHVSAAETIDLCELSYLSEGNGESFGLSGTLMQRAIDAFGKAREAHAGLEDIYIPSMNFEKLDLMVNSLIHSIFTR